MPAGRLVDLHGNWSPVAPTDGAEGGWAARWGSFVFVLRALLGRGAATNRCGKYTYVLDAYTCMLPIGDMFILSR